MTFDSGFYVWIGTKDFGGGTKGSSRIGANVRFIQIEVRVFDLVFENLVSVAICIGRLGIHGAGDGNAHAGIGGTAGTGGGDRVCGGIAWSDLGGAFRGNWADFRRDS